MITEIDNYNILAHNTFRMNVTARKWIEYTSAKDLPSIFASIGDEKFRCIGEGSNLLFLGDYDGTLLHSRILDIEMSPAAGGGTDLRIGSGVKLDDVIAQLAAAGIWGLENLSLIPGYAGSAAVQNVGAYGVEIKDFVTSVECYDRTVNRFITLGADECKFAYRDSVFKRPENRERYVVTHLNLHLPAHGAPRLGYGHLKSALADIENPRPMDVREAIIEMRRSKLPDVESVGSAGSFFKNPVVSEEVFERIKDGSSTEVPHYITDKGVKIPAAWLIDQCGWKGRRIGSAGVWGSQPLVLVNADGRCTPSEIVSLEENIKNDVRQRFGIALEAEVDHI